MPLQVDPRYFQFGSEFLRGMSVAQEGKRRDEMVAQDAANMELAKRRQGLAEQEYSRGLQEDQQAAQAAGARDRLGQLALAAAQGHRPAGVALLSSLSLPEELADDPDAGKLYAALAERFGYKLPRADQAAMPADVQSALWYEKATPEQRSAFNVTKRNPIAPQLAIVGGVPTLVERAPGSEGNQIPLSDLGREQGAAAGKASATTTAEEQAKVRVGAQADLPRIEINAQQANGALDDLATNPSFDSIWGLHGKVPAIPGTEKADALAKWEQIQGKAFLEAFSTLKGGGAITEVEGQKATAAITSLANRNQSPGAARKAITDLRAIIQSGVERARRKAGGGGGSEAPSASSGVKRVKVDAEGNQIGN